MPAAARGFEPQMSDVEFRAFQEGRPDHERWELIAGVPVMMTPPLMEHNVIATNLQSLLNATLREHDESRFAVQRPGIAFSWPMSVLAEMERTGGYSPEPDVAVVDYGDVIAGERFTGTAYLLAEIVSSTDEDPTSASGERWIDVKARLYREHPPCQAVVIVEQGRVHVTTHTQVGEGWTRWESTDLDDPFEIPSAGLVCRVGDLYADTRWQPRQPRGGRP